MLTVLAPVSGSSTKACRLSAHFRLRILRSSTSVRVFSEFRFKRVRGEKNIMKIRLERVCFHLLVFCAERELKSSFDSRCLPTSTVAFCAQGAMLRVSFSGALC